MKNFVGVMMLFLVITLNPAGGAAHPVDGDVYVGFTTGSSVIETYDGIIGFPRMPLGFIYTPSPVGGVAMGPDGNLYVGFTETHEVQVYDANGIFIRNFFVGGPVSGMVFGSNGLLHVAYSNFPVIELYDGTSGKFCRALQHLSSPPSWGAGS
ncbi:MAG: hypothetical protein ABFS18_01770 [Thermodesulfobacteriota bacterium]